MRSPKILVFAGSIRTASFNARLAALALLSTLVPAAGRGHHGYYWQNLNPLLGVYRGAIGIKTGYTPDAGHCLLFEATRDGRSFIGVNLDSPGIGTTVNGQAATRMLNWAFSLRSY